MTVNVECLGKITATKDVLNKISMGFYTASKFHLIHNRKTLSERYRKIANEICDELNKEGYFEID